MSMKLISKMKDGGTSQSRGNRTYDANGRLVYNFDRTGRVSTLFEDEKMKPRNVKFEKDDPDELKLQYITRRGFYTPKRLQSTIDSLNNVQFNNPNNKNWKAYDYVDYMLKQSDVENNKKNPKGGWDSKHQMWVWHKSPEGGAPTIAYGFKQGNHPELEKLIKIQGGLYDDQAKMYLRHASKQYVEDAQHAYSNIYGWKSWAGMNPRVQAQLAMYQYGTKGGVNGFPNSMNAAHNRYYDDVQRNINGASKAKNNILNQLMTPVEDKRNFIPLYDQIINQWNK